LKSKNCIKVCSSKFSDRWNYEDSFSRVRNRVFKYEGIKSTWMVLPKYGYRKLFLMRKFLVITFLSLFAAFSTLEAEAVTTEIDSDSSITNLVINPGDTLQINSGVTLTITGTVENFGTINNDGTIINFGTLNNQAGIIEINAGAIIENSGGTINNESGFIIINAQGRIINGGIINNEGIIQILSGGVLENPAGGTINNNGIIDDAAINDCAL